MRQTFLFHLECSRCGATYPADRPQTICPTCGKPLLARYDLQGIAATLAKEELAGREATIWRYREFLPVTADEHVISLGEGFTPLIRATNLGRAIGIRKLWIKDESRMPTGTFKDRGLAVAVSKAKEFGLTRVAIPSAGNAAASLAAYGARAGLEVFVFMPEDAPWMNKLECFLRGARVFLVKGLIGEAGQVVRRGREALGWFDMSTLKEPYRVEGKKTMGLELAEQLGWELPDVILYPTGGGTGLIGMWKAFAELEEIGWISSERPRMIAVQAEGCAPIVRAYHEGKEAAEPWEQPKTIAAGIRVPNAIGDFLILQVIRESGGTAIAASDEEILGAMELLAHHEGIMACPEGAATLAAARKLREQGLIEADERVVAFNTGTGLKYPEALELPELPLLDPTGDLLAALHEDG
jgi:threonine synthase